MRAIAKRVHDGERPTTTPRTILSWYHYERRGSWIVSRIKGEMDALRITASEDIAWSYIDGELQFLPLTEVPEKRATKPEAEAIEASNSASVVVEIPVLAEEEEVDDPTYRIGSLQSANIPPTSVTPDSTVQEAATKMKYHDFSQLPVMTSERELKGLITWESVSARLMAGGSCEVVRDCMRKNPPVVDFSAPLFGAIDTILQHGCVIVRDHTRLIRGIVTTADLGKQFVDQTEPFLLLGEIENHIRSIIANRFTRKELQAARDPADSERIVTSVFEMSFGEYVRLIQAQDRWEKLELRGEDRATFVNMLNEVREVRNEVMHFAPEKLADSKLEKLQKFARLLQRLRELRVEPEKVN